MSLNCKQLKQKYEELLSEKEKFVLEYEKFKDGGDDKELKELKTKLENSNKEIREILMYPGYVFDTLKVLASSNNIVIQDTANICNYNSKGELAGRVQIGRKWYPFYSDTIVKQIAGQDFENVYDIHTQPNGDLAGQVYISGKWYPFYGDTIVRKIADQDFSGVYDIHTQPNGELAGGVQIDGKVYSFHGDTLVRQIANQDIGGVYDIHTQLNGDLAGWVHIAGKLYPFHGDILVRQIAGQDFENVVNIHTQPNGDLAGKVEIAGKWYPFIFDGEKYVLLEEVNK